MDVSEILKKSKEAKMINESEPIVRYFFDSLNIFAKIEDIARSIINSAIPMMIYEAKLLTEQKISSLFSEALPKTIESVNERVEEEIERLTKEVKKGDKGDCPVLGIDYELPEDGKDYILTEQDKIDIASSIKVPVVEKTVETIIEKQPIVTNKIVEKAVSDTPEVIANKLNTLEEKIDIKVIKGLENWLNRLGKSIQEKKGGGGGDLVYIEDLSSQTNGVLKTFSVPKHRKALMVMGSDFPSVLFKDNGFTDGDTTITLTVTNAPSAGSQLGFQYVK